MISWHWHCLRYIGHAETDTRTKTQTRANGHLNYQKRQTVWEMGKNMENNFAAFESDERKKQKNKTFSAKCNLHASIELKISIN